MSRLVQLSEAASLALHSAARIAAEPGGPVSVRRLAEGGGVSENHLSKVMQRLVKAGILRSIRGPKGGFALAGPADSVSLLDIYEAIEGKMETFGCPVHRTECVFTCCIFGGLLDRCSRDTEEYFREKKLSGIIAKARKEKP